MLYYYMLRFQIIGMLGSRHAETTTEREAAKLSSHQAAPHTLSAKALSSSRGIPPYFDCREEWPGLIGPIKDQGKKQQIVILCNSVCIRQATVVAVGQCLPRNAFLIAQLFALEFTKACLLKISCLAAVVVVGK